MTKAFSFEQKRVLFIAAALLLCMLYMFECGQHVESVISFDTSPAHFDQAPGSSVEGCADQYTNDCNKYCPQPLIWSKKINSFYDCVDAGFLKKVEVVSISHILQTNVSPALAISVKYPIVKSLFDQKTSLLIYH